MNININIAEEFTRTPGGRYHKEGDFSGEDFRRNILLSNYKKVKENDGKLIINLDETYGYATSFLEESFGGLVRELKEDILVYIEFVSVEEPYLINDIKAYVEDELKRI